MTVDAQLLVRTGRFADDLAVLIDELGFRVETIFPADAPATAVVSGHGVRLRLESAPDPSPATLLLVTDDPRQPRTLPGGTVVEYRRRASGPVIPDNDPSLVVSVVSAEGGVGRAGMHYRDLLPDRWGGRFIASHITIPDGGPVPDYVHYHRIRFQLIFVKTGWVRVVYEDQGEPFVMHAGDAVLQPPEIRHRVLESSPGLEVIEIGCPAEHETIADWSLELPTTEHRPDRDFGGQRFVRHVAADAIEAPWRIDGWRCRDTGIAAATDGLAGVRVARPATNDDAAHDPPTGIEHATEFAQLVVLAGAVTFEAAGRSTRLGPGDSAAIPGGTSYRLAAPTPDCELLDVTMPADFEIVAAPATVDRTPQDDLRFPA